MTRKDGLPRKIFQHAAMALLRARPTTGVRLAGALGRVRQLLHPGSSAADVAAAVGARPLPELRRIAREIAVTAYRNAAVDLLTRWDGIPALTPLVSVARPEILKDLRALGRPVVLVMIHEGPTVGLVAALLRLGEPALIVRAYPRYAIPPGFEFCFTGDGDERRAFVLKRSLDHLRAGGLVAMAVDVPGIPVKVLGKSLTLPRGPAVLSRLTGAAVVPVRSLWRRDHTIEVGFEDPIVPPGPAAGEHETVLTRQLCDFIERSTRSHPGQMWPSRLNDLAGAPALGVEAPA